MKKRITATDMRYCAAGPNEQITVEYDPEDIIHYDTRGKCYSAWDESWGRYVDVPEGRLFLKRTYRTDGENPTQYNTLQDIPY